MKKTVWTFGLIAGGILSAMMAGQMSFHDQLGFERAEVIGYTSIVLAFLLIFFGIRSYRDNVAGGSVSFGRAFAIGALIALVASACYVGTWEVIYYNNGEVFMAKYQSYAVEKARAAGDSPAEIDKKVADMQRYAQLYRNPLINVAVTLIEPLPIGLVVALISAGILGRRRKRAGVGAPVIA